MDDKQSIHEENRNPRCEGLTIRQLLEDLCVRKQGIYSEQTLQHYIATIPEVLADFIDREYTTMTYDGWLFCRTRLAATDNRDGTHRRKWDTVRGLAKFAAETYHYPSTVDYIENFRIRAQRLVPYIDPARVYDFLATVDDPVLYVLYALDFATGLRLGEITALEPSDVDFTQRRLSIDKECRYNIGGGWKILYYTKTSKSTAFVEFPTWLVEPLRSLISSGHKFVFDRGDGTPIRAGRINYQLKRYARLSGSLKSQSRV